MNDAPDAPGPGSLEEELSHHHLRCWGFALACCRSEREEAEDVLQTAYLKVLDGRARYGGRSSFATWLFGVIRKTAAERRRTRFRRRLALARRTAPGPAASAAPDTGADAARLRRELAGLPRRQREVLHLVFYAELSIAEAATVMGVSLGSARTHYERGKSRLRRRLHAGEAT